MRPIIKPFNRVLFNRVAILSLALLLIGLSACGFQLRGTKLQALQDANIYVQSSGAKTLASQVKQQLLDAGVEPVTTASAADYVVSLSNESFDTKVLSVSPTTGKVEEYEVTYTALLKITNRNEKTTATAESISATRDYTFDDGSVLGKVKEESVLKKDIAKQVAASVLRRLRAAVQ